MKYFKKTSYTQSGRSLVFMHEQPISHLADHEAKDFQILTCIRVRIICQRLGSNIMHCRYEIPSLWNLATIWLEEQINYCFHRFQIFYPFITCALINWLCPFQHVPYSYPMVTHCYSKTILWIIHFQLVGKYFPYNCFSYGIMAVVAIYHWFYFKTHAKVTSCHFWSIHM